MTRFQLVAIRLLLLALVLAAWETLPRNGVINPMLLPPLGDELPLLELKLVEAGVLVKLPYAVSWSPPIPRRSRPNDCQAQ